MRYTLVQRTKAEIDRLNAEIAEKRQEVEQATERLRKIDRKIHEQFERMKVLSMRDRALTRIEDVLDGRITHIVVTNWYGTKIEVKPVEEAMKVPDEPRKLRLLSLYGDSRGNLEWNLSRYSDGSGSSDWAYPATSEDEAIEIARNRCLEKLGEPGYREDTELMESCRRFGVEYPAELAESIRRRKVDDCARRVERMRKDLEEAEADLSKASEVKP